MGDAHGCGGECETPHGSAVASRVVGKGPALFRSRLADDSGVTAIEYGLLAALIAVAIIVGVGALGLKVEAMYLFVCNKVVAAIGGGGC